MWQLRIRLVKNTQALRGNLVQIKLDLVFIKISNRLHFLIRLVFDKKLNHKKNSVMQAPQKSWNFEHSGLQYDTAVKIL